MSWCGQMVDLICSEAEYRNMTLSLSVLKSLYVSASSRLIIVELSQCS